MKNTERDLIRKQESSKLMKEDLHPDTEEIIKEACGNFKGQMNTLESAIGALYIGQIYGWRVLRICHGSNTYNKYEKVFGENFKFKDYCPDKGTLGRRNVGLALAEKINSFWKVATGKYKEDKDLKSIEE